MIGVGIGIPFAPLHKGVLVYDSFNRPDNTMSPGIADTGQEWDVQSGQYGIRSGKLYKVSGSGGGDYNQLVIDSGRPNVRISVEMTIQTDSNGGLAFRNSDNVNFFHAVSSFNRDKIQLQKYVGGSVTTIGEYETELEVGATYNISVRAIGDSITVYLDDNKIISVSDSFNQNATAHGIRIPADALNQMDFDNFIVEAFP